MNVWYTDKSVLYFYHDFVLSILSVCLSVRLFVCPMPVLCLDEWTYRHIYDILVFSSPIAVTKF